MSSSSTAEKTPQEWIVTEIENEKTMFEELKTKYEHIITDAEEQEIIYRIEVCTCRWKLVMCTDN